MKTVQEWSDAFDVLVAEYVRLNRSGFVGPLAFDEYEKSLFLTKAQEEIVQSLYNGTLTTESFEETEAARHQLDSLVKQEVYSESEPEGQPIHDKYVHSLYHLPEDCWYVVFEQVTTAKSDTPCMSEKTMTVLPTTHDEYSRIIRNPFRGPSSNRVLRLNFEKSGVELVSNVAIGEYLVRYLSKPSPIVLCDLTTEGLSIEGVQISTACILSELVHPAILNRAVQLAVASRASSNQV